MRKKSFHKPSTSNNYIKQQPAVKEEEANMKKKLE
jgi:hypothetical protein